jgi:hypothetical protein
VEWYDGYVYAAFWLHFAEAFFPGGDPRPRRRPAHALTLALFGGTADMVALWSKRNGMESGFYGYVTACIARSLPVYLWMPDTRATSLIDRDPD